MGPLPDQCVDHDPTPPPDLCKSIQDWNPNCRLLFNQIVERWQVWEEHRKYPGNWACVATWEDPQDNSYLPPDYGILNSLMEWDSRRFPSPQAWVDELQRQRKAKADAEDKQFENNLEACVSGDKRIWKRYVDDNRPIGLTREENVALAEAADDQC